MVKDPVTRNMSGELAAVVFATMLPPPAKAETLRTVFNVVHTTVGAAGHPIVDGVVHTHETSTGRVPVLGRTESLDPHAVALAVGIPVGAAVAAGRLLGLDPARLRATVGLAATQSAGLVEALGTMAKSLQSGKAAAVEFEAAVLAGHGFDGPAAPIEGRRGLLALHAGRVNPAAMVDGLGVCWELERAEIKAVRVRRGRPRDHRRRQECVGAVRRGAEVRAVDGQPVRLVAMGRTEPAAGLAAKFSATHCFAVGYRYGHADPLQFSDHAVTLPELVALRDRCELVADESLPRYGVRTEITGAGGEVWRTVRHRPARLDAAGVRRKAVALTEPVLGDRAAGFVTLAFDPAAASVAELLTAGIPAV